MGNILIIDDDRLILDFLTDTLTHFGHSVEVATDGEEGLRLFQNTEGIDMVITDMDMPKTNGILVAKSIKESSNSSVPIVAMTGFFPMGDIHREFFDDLLVKPFKIEQLLDIIKIHIK